MAARCLSRITACACVEIMFAGTWSDGGPRAHVAKQFDGDDGMWSWGERDQPDDVPGCEDAL